MSKMMETPRLYKAISSDFLLRSIDEKTVNEYAELMKGGVQFPDVTLGILNGIEILVDGAHRVCAAQQAGVKNLPVTLKNYETSADILADQLFSNRHGRPVEAKDRDNYIKKLREAGWTEQRIAKAVGLAQSSVHRILSGEQQQGRKAGEASAEGSEKRNKPVSGKAAAKMFIKIAKALQTKHGKTEFLDAVENNEEITRAISETVNQLSRMELV